VSCGRESPALRALDLSIGYRVKGSGDRVLASALNLEIPRGCFVCVLGANGSGKSTLLRSLAGAQPPLGGRVEIAGRNLGDLTPGERARAVSLVLTERPSLASMTAWDLAAMGRHPHTGWMGRLGGGDRERVQWALEAAGAADLASRLCSELSDGERQKAMIARALAQDAKLIVLDEPTVFLDLPRRVELLSTLKRLAHREGLAVLMSTHDLELALRSADALWLLDGRGAVCQGMPEELVLRGDLQEVFCSEKLDWDDQRGGFAQRSSSGRVLCLEAEGRLERWTSRALLRIGWGVAFEGEAVSIRVFAWESEGAQFWRLKRPGCEDRRYERLSELIRDLEYEGEAETLT